MKILHSNLFKKSGIEEMKDMTGLTRNMRSDATPFGVLEDQFDRGISGGDFEEEKQRLDDAYRDALLKLKMKEEKDQQEGPDQFDDLMRQQAIEDRRRESVFAFTVCSKK